MKLNKIISSVRSKIETAKIVKRENHINRYFNVHDNTLYGDANNQLYHARKGISQYAEKNRVTVDVYDARHLLNGDEHVSPVLENDFSSKMHVVVTNLLNNKKETRIMSADTDALYTKESRQTFLMPIPGEQDLQIPRNAIRYTEDTFLRNLYRNIEEMVKLVTKQAKNK